ncbi:MAG: DEAD/DEAH box helicase [Bacteroidia bacterium]|nr:DEAD/DEAH box helicase [Bacteroidia bacterium]
MMQFNEMGLDPRILKGIQKMGFEQPSPIQEQFIPLFLKKPTDIVGLAQTGTGKTAAFGLPMLQIIDPKNRVPQALIISPTRELCVQIAREISDYAKYLPDISIVPIYGGADIGAQLTALRKGVHIIVATPGRLHDMIRKNKVDLSQVSILVLDEADEMLNMGFQEDVDAILEKTPKTKNTLLFSATMPKEIAAIAKNYMTNPIEIAIGKKGSGAENVEHIYHMVHAKDRYSALKRVMDFVPDIYGIVFCRTRIETNEIASQLIQDGYSAEALHGDLSQAQRDYVMEKFRTKGVQMLIATDVAARGLDVNDLTHIINYNLPDDIENYTHRSGRTGRAGKSGISISIIHMKEQGRIRMIEKGIGKKFLRMPVPTGKVICEKQLMFLIDKLQSVTINEDEIAPFLPSVYEKMESLSKEDLIKHFVSLEFNRFIEYYGNTADLNAPDTHDGSRREGREGRDGREGRRNSSEGLTQFRLNVGLLHGLIPKDIITFVIDATGSRNVEIGKIELFKSHALVEIDSQAATAFLKNSRGMNFRGSFFDAEVNNPGHDRGDRGFDRGGDRGDRGGRFERGLRRPEGGGEFKRRDRKKRF